MPTVNVLATPKPAPIKKPVLLSECATPREVPVVFFDLFWASRFQTWAYVGVNVDGEILFSGRGGGISPDPEITGPDWDFVLGGVGQMLDDASKYPEMEIWTDHSVLAAKLKYVTDASSSLSVPDKKPASKEALEELARLTEEAKKLPMFDVTLTTCASTDYDQKLVGYGWVVRMPDGSKFMGHKSESMDYIDPARPELLAIKYGVQEAIRSHSRYLKKQWGTLRVHSNSEVAPVMMEQFRNKIAHPSLTRDSDKGKIAQSILSNIGKANSTFELVRGRTWNSELICANRIAKVAMEGNEIDIGGQSVEEFIGSVFREVTGVRRIDETPTVNLVAAKPTPVQKPTLLIECAKTKEVPVILFAPVWEFQFQAWAYVGVDTDGEVLFSGHGGGFSDTQVESVRDSSWEYILEGIGEMLKDASKYPEVEIYTRHKELSIKLQEVAEGTSNLNVMTSKPAYAKAFLELGDLVTAAKRNTAFDVNLTTDASVHPDRKVAGFGWVGQLPANGTRFIGYDAHPMENGDTTKAELLAINYGVQHTLRQYAPWLRRGWGTLRIHSDSKAATTLMSQVKNGVHRDKLIGRSAHCEIARALFPKIGNTEMSFEWVRGHNGDTMNEFADRLANAARRTKDNELGGLATEKIIDSIRHEVLHLGKELQLQLAS